MVVSSSSRLSSFSFSAALAFRRSTTRGCLECGGSNSGGRVLRVCFFGLGNESFWHHHWPFWAQGRPLAMDIDRECAKNPPTDMLVTRSRFVVERRRSGGCEVLVAKALNATVVGRELEQRSPALHLVEGLLVATKECLASVEMRPPSALQSMATFLVLVQDSLNSA
jgi:hypothetical protein